MMEERKFNPGRLALAIILFAVFLRAFIFEGLIVRGDSMSPVILSGDYVLVNRLSYINDGPERGDIVVTLTRDGRRVVKRVMGLPGDMIQTATGKKTNVDPGEYFLVGDNASVSVDSNEFGFVDSWDIKGRAFGALRIKNLKYVDL